MKQTAMGAFRTVKVAFDLNTEKQILSIKKWLVAKIDWI